MAKSTQVNISTGGMGLDTRDFARFAKALRKSEVELAAQLKVALRSAVKLPRIGEGQGFLMSKRTSLGRSKFVSRVPPCR